MWTYTMNARSIGPSPRAVSRDRDLIIIKGARGSDLDPSTSGDDGFTSKWGVDATAKPLLKDFTPRHHFPDDVWDGIDVEALLS